MVPGGGHAARIRQLTPPILRVRYRHGVAVNLHGFPEWDLYARAVVELPAPEPDLTVDEVRALDVLTANELMVLTGDPLWSFTANDYAALTPPGWVWTHLAFSRRLALVPAELHGAFRHSGGAAQLEIGRGRRGVRIDDSTPVPMDYRERLAEPLVAKLEGALGRALPEAYRLFLAHTNGAVPTTPGIHPRYGFVVDQPLFGLARADRHQDLYYANGWFRDRLTADFLAIGYVQGGLLVLRTAGEAAGSVWYQDDDDYRDDDSYDADHLCQHLLYRCADDFDAFWHSLAVAPRWMLNLVDTAVRSGRARVVATEGQGAALPTSKQRNGSGSSS